jgi:ATP-dependent DNA helicase RecQ
MSDIHQILRERFHLESFRAGQAEIIENILRGFDCLIVMPTGSGKSLCYQIPAIARGGVCLVVSPLIALMQDQVRALSQLRIPAACLHSGLSAQEKATVLEQVQCATQFILYVSPERLRQEFFLSYLKQIKLSLIVIDEAHCIVDWGAEFRPDYQKLYLLKERFSVPIVALTASATIRIRKEIVSHLRLKNPIIQCFGFFRPQLFYQVQSCSDTEEKLEIVMAALNMVKLGRRLIYCRTRLQCEMLASRLLNENFIADFYHAGLSSERRLQIQTEMEQSKIEVLCCTCAFGMGIDYPDVRLVVHFEAPSSLEELYQEMGRAGRDLKFARALTLYSERDLEIRKKQIEMQGLESKESTRKLKALLAMIEYLGSRKKCRHQMISEHFGDFVQFKNSAACGVCDNCHLKGTLDKGRERIPKIHDIGLRNRLRKLPARRSPF